ncbi:hypothetical protein K438DRAFT_1961005 [Mycena galopus ATCC 62051]|nr:hypothetical protein K438DRAFT_1961005 [Mycena galopus ATCC 62051]
MPNMPTSIQLAGHLNGIHAVTVSLKNLISAGADKVGLLSSVASVAIDGVVRMFSIHMSCLVSHLLLRCLWDDVLHTPGHTLDSICLHVPQDHVLYTADTVFRQGTTVFEDLTTYITSLCKMLVFANAEGALILYPGHGYHRTAETGVVSRPWGRAVRVSGAGPDNMLRWFTAKGTHSSTVIPYFAHSF